MNDDTTPHGTMDIAYDRASDPVTIGLELTNDGFDVVRFAYGFAGYSDGRGRFDYRFRKLNGDVLTVTTGYDATGAGRARVDYTPAGAVTPAGTFQHCSDAAACLTYVNDPTDYTCGFPCTPGSLSSCVDVPLPAPF